LDSNSLSRLLVGLLLVSIFLLSYIYNFDNFLILSIVILSTYDFYNIKIKKKYLLLALIMFAFIFFTFFPIDLFKYTCFFEILIIFTILFWSRYKKVLFVISIYLFCLILFYFISTDRTIFYTIIFISFFNDTIAYISGKLIGGPRIVSKLSPKKTWSGTLVSLSTSFILLIYINFNIFLSFIVAISLFFGDIFFSYIKRYLMIKDFSSVLGSHGGVLDRLDSMFFATIIFQVYLFF